LNKQKPYKPKQFNLSALKGISDETLETHFKLYDGYVENTNRLNKRLSTLLEYTGGLVKPEQMPVYAELKRRLDFEYNGMVLHEMYFENLKKNGTGEPSKDSLFRRFAEMSFGSFDLWKMDFMNVGEMRGIGWAICYQNPFDGRLVNHWITSNEEGHVAGFAPILVMGVWEHAYLLDYKPAKRPKYIAAFFSNIDWEVTENRLKKMAIAKPASIAAA